MEALSLLRDRDENLVRWKQVWSLSALYASIIIGWIAYYRYQPILLQQYGFQGFSFLLALAQAIILVITPPIAGRLGDRYRATRGHRLPIIAAGISFVAMIFMAVSFTLLSNPGETLRWVLPVLIICWLMGMSIFTSPALSTIELFAPVDRLPQLMAVLTIVSNLLYALEPVVVELINYLGAPVTFAVGGAAVFVSGYALKKNSLSLFRKDENEVLPERTAKGKKSPYAKLFLMGVGLGTATTVLFNLFPAKLASTLSPWTGAVEGNLMVVLLLVFAALISWPVSRWVMAAGLDRSLRVSLLIVMAAMAGVLIVDVPLILVAFSLIFIVALTALSVSALPLVIREASLAEKVFCVGVFYSGVALPDGILESILAYS